MTPTEDFTDDERQQIMRVVKHFAVQSGWPSDSVAQRLTDMYHGSRRILSNTVLLANLMTLTNVFDGKGEGFAGSLQSYVNSRN